MNAIAKVARAGRPWGRLVMGLGMFLWTAAVAGETAPKLYESWRWAHFTSDSGLPSNRVLEVVETPSGTVWASTQNGLTWYDGYRWHAVLERDGVPEQRSYYLVPFAEDSLLAVVDGRLYVGDTGGFREVPVPDEDTRQQVVGAVPLAPTRVLVLVAETHDSPVGAYSYQGGTLEPEDTPSPVAWGRWTKHSWSGRGRGVWLNTERGLYRWEGEWVLRLASSPEATVVAGNVAEGITGHGLATIVHPPRLRGLWEWEPGGTPARAEPAGRHLVNGMDIDPDGDALVAYASGELQVRNVGGEWSPLLTPPLEMDSVRFVRFRDNGDLWVGNERGLSLHRRSSNLWTYWQQDSTDLGNMVLEILPASDGSVWYGTGRGVRRRDVHGVVDSFETIDGNLLDEVTGLAEDNDGNIWISSGSTFQGTYRWDGNDWRHFGTDDGLVAQRVHKIRKDRRGRLWFLGMARVLGREPTELEPGPFLYSDGRFERWGPADGLPSRRTYAFVETDDALWFGTAGGLSRWRNHEWTHWTSEQGLRANKVFVVTEGPMGTIWFGHQELGLGYLDGDRPRYLTTADGLVHDEVWDLGVDRTGRIWVSTQGGLCSYGDEEWACFDITSGLNNERLWPLRVAEDRVYVGTLGNGVNVLNLAETDGPAPRVEMSEPAIDGDTALLRWQAYEHSGVVAPAVVPTRYRMRDDAWSEWSTTRQLRVQLTAGRHDFEVQAKGLFGKVSPSPSTKTFTVAPPLYRSPAFLLPVSGLVAIVLGLLGMLAVRKRRHDLAIRTSERNLRTIFENVQDAFFQTDPQGRILEMSPSVRLHLGQTREQALGTRLQEHAADPEDAERLLHLLRTDGEVRDHEIRTRGTESQESFVSVSAHMLRDGAGVGIGFEGVLRDVSEYKRIQSALLQAGRELEKRVKERTRELGQVNTALELEVAERRTAEEALRESETELRDLSQRLIKAQEEERRRLARDLHDDLNQRLALFAMKLQRLGAQPPGSAGGLAASAHDLWEQINELCLDVQRMAYQLHPSKLEELGLVVAVRSFCKDLSEQAGLRVRFVECDVPERVPPEVALTIYRVIQESLWNVAKHSGADEALVELIGEDHCMRVSIFDPGCGFDVEAARGNGLGLLSMRERLRLVGGEIQIESSASSGTRVAARAPCREVQPTV